MDSEVKVGLVFCKHPYHVWMQGMTAGTHHWCLCGEWFISKWSAHPWRLNTINRIFVRAYIAPGGPFLFRFSMQPRYEKNDSSNRYVRFDELVTERSTAGPPHCPYCNQLIPPKRQRRIPNQPSLAGPINHVPTPSLLDAPQL